MAKKILISALSLLLSVNTFACTDIKVVAKDGTVMISRSMEFAQDLKSNINTSPRGRNFTTTAPNNKPGMSWKSQYGYIFLDGLNAGFAIDGMNDQGLSFEALYLPGETQYQNVPDSQEAHAIPYYNMGDWILGNFKSVAEVKAALANVYVYAAPISQAPNMTFPLHFSIYETSGKGIVVEFIKGKMNIYDNAIGVMTNSPTYDWHITNLRNYVNLTPVTPKPVIDNGITFVATGQGSGMHGLPGDISPPSRFVKMAIMLKTVFQPSNSIEALNLSTHIMNNVDIPLGFVREGTDINKSTTELTQWVVFKDLTHKVLYYRSYSDMNMHMVDMTKLNFAENAPQKKIPVASQQAVVDMTAQMQGT